MSEQAKVTRGRFEIIWRDGAYYVSIPNYDGGEVVKASVADALLATCEFAIKAILTNDPIAAVEQLRRTIALAQSKPTREENDV